jgi:hypothetical protein
MSFKYSEAYHRRLDSEIKVGKIQARFSFKAKGLGSEQPADDEEVNDSKIQLEFNIRTVEFRTNILF